MRISLLAIALSVALPMVAFAQGLRTPPPTSGPAQPAPGLTDESSDVRMMLRQAQALRESGDARNALRIVKQILDRDARNVDAINEEGELSWILNDFDGTRRAFLYARQIQPNDYRSNLGLGKLYANARIPRQAIYYFDIAARVAPADKQAEVLTALALAHRDAGQVSDGIPIARKAVEADPKNFDARMTLVQLLNAGSDFKSARDESTPLVEQARDEALAKPGNLGALQKLQRAYDVRLTVLKSATEKLYLANPDGTRSDKLIDGKEAEAASNLKELTDLYIRQGELNLTFTYVDALNFAKRAAEYTPRDIDAVLNLAQLHRSISQIDEAAAACRRVLLVDPKNKPALDMLVAMNAPIEGPTEVGTATSQPASSPAAGAATSTPSPSPKPPTPASAPAPIGSTPPTGISTPAPAPSPTPSSVP